MKKDEFFKLLMIGQDEGSQFLRQLIVEEGLGIEYRDVIVQNPNMPPLNEGNKEMFFDTLLKDDIHRFIHLEMQRYHINEEFYARIFSYGCRIIVDEIKEGENYNNGTVVYQCIFLEMKGDCDELTQTYQHIANDGTSYPVKKIVTTFVYLKNIEKILKRKTLLQLTMFECLIYLFNYGLDDDIIKIDKKVVKIMANKQEEYNREYAALLEERSIRDHENFVNNTIKKYEKMSEDYIQLSMESEEQLENIFKGVYHIVTTQNMSIEEAFDVMGVSQEKRKVYVERFKNLN